MFRPPPPQARLKIYAFISDNKLGFDLSQNVTMSGSVFVITFKCKIFFFSISVFIWQDLVKKLKYFFTSMLFFYKKSAAERPSFFLDNLTKLIVFQKNLLNQLFFYKNRSSFFTRIYILKTEFLPLWGSCVANVQKIHVRPSASVRPRPSVRVRPSAIFGRFIEANEHA